jgi:hypothetical protein
MGAAPMTSQQLAERTQLNERYLREWTATMAASGYLDYDPAGASFKLNSDRQWCLRARTPPSSWAEHFSIPRHVTARSQVDGSL